MCCKFTIFGRSVVIGGKKTYPSWDRHIDNVAAKGNRTLVFIRRNLRERIKQVRETSYLTILRPTLEYAAMVWDPTIQTLIQTLENVQRRTARLVINDYTSRTQGCVTSMLTSLEQQTLKQRRRISRLVIMYKIQHQLVDIDRDLYLRPGDTTTPITVVNIYNNTSNSSKVIPPTLSQQLTSITTPVIAAG